jgi:phosphatidylglycerophosphate synthase
MMLTMTYLREHRRLLSSALIVILPVALAMVALAAYATIQLQLSGWYVGKSIAVFSLGAALILRGLIPHHPFISVGPGNVVTLLRGALVVLLTALIGEGATPVAATAAVAAGVAALVCLLDGMDGWLARQSGMASSFGARFDMETDAVLVTVLATLAWQFGKVGAWVLWSGGLRYLYLFAAVIAPVLQRPLPPSPLRKTIAVVQIIALIAVLSPLLSPSLSARIAATALAALAFSFCQQALQAYRQPSVGAPAAAC